MAVVRVGNRGTKTGTASALGFATISPSSEVLAGDLLVMLVGVVGGLAAIDVNDTQGNEWNTDVGVLNTARVAICTCVLANELTPTDVLTLQVGASAVYNLDLEEFSGVTGTQFFDKSATGTGAGTALTAGTTATLSQAAEVAIAAWAINAAESSFTPAGGYTAFGIVSQTGLGLLGEFLVVNATTAQSPTGTAGTTGTWAGAVTTYKAGAGTPEIRGPDAFLTR